MRTRSNRVCRGGAGIDRKSFSTTATPQPPKDASSTARRFAFRSTATTSSFAAPVARKSAWRSAPSPADGSSTDALRASVPVGARAAATRSRAVSGCVGK